MSLTVASSVQTMTVPEAPLFLSLRMPASNKEAEPAGEKPSSPLEPLHELSNILEIYLDSDEDLFLWGSHVIRDFNSTTLFGAELEQEIQRRLKLLDALIRKCTENFTRPHLFAQEMDRWRKSLPLRVTDPVSARERRIVRAEEESKMVTSGDPAPLSESPEIAALRQLTHSLIAHTVKKTEKDLQKAKTTRAAAAQFEIFEQQLRATIDAETTAFKAQMQEHQKQTEKLFQTAEKDHQKAMEILESRIEICEEETRETQDALSKETKEKEAKIAEVRELRKQMWLREQEMQRIRDQNRDSGFCVIL